MAVTQKAYLGSNLIKSYYLGEDKVITSGSFNLSPLSIQYIVVAGGGGGGYSISSTQIGGGGGAGGVVTGSADLGILGELAATIGGGGSAGTAGSAPGNGSNSTFSGKTALGGGAGGDSSSENGKSGGSGGGAFGGANPATGGSATQPGSASGGFGFKGGDRLGSPIRSGGGGGAGEAGFTGGGAFSGAGGVGGTGHIWLDGVNYGVGGGVTTYTGNKGYGGNYGGASSTNGTAGEAGVVVVRYAGTPKATGGTITQSGGYTYHTFTSNGTFKYTGNLDINALQFIEAAGIVSTTQQLAINNLVLDLKRSNLWSKMNAVYPFVGGTATTHKFNLINPQDTDAGYRLTFSGGITHSASGITTDGVDGFADTYLNISTQLGGGQNDTHMFMYLGNMFGGQSGVDMGGADTYAQWMNSRNPSNIFNSRHNNATTNGIASTSSSGCFTISRTDSSSYLQSINKTHTTVNNASTGTPNKTVYIGALNGVITSDYQNRLFSMVTLGYGLTSSEIDTLVDINQTYQTALSRFV